MTTNEIKTLEHLNLVTLAAAPELPMTGEGQVYLIDLGSGQLKVVGRDENGALTLPHALLSDSESLTESSTTSTAYQQKLSLGFTVLTAGRYRLEWSYELRSIDSGNSDRRAEARVQLDNATNYAENQVSKAQYRSNNSVSIYEGRSGWAYVTLTAAAHTLDLDYRVSSGSGQAFIRRARLAVRHA